MNYLPELRAYFFVNNLYMSEKQWGIQSMHALSELYKKKLAGQQKVMLDSWQDNDKTVIILQGTNCAGLKFFENVVGYACKKLNYPHSVFYEDEDSLNGAITCVMALVPIDVVKIEKDEILPTREELSAMVSEDMWGSGSGETIYDCILPTKKTKDFYITLLKATIGTGRLA